MKNIKSYFFGLSVTLNKKENGKTDVLFAMLRLRFSPPSSRVKVASISVFMFHICSGKKSKTVSVEGVQSKYSVKKFSFCCCLGPSLQCASIWTGKACRDEQLLHQIQSVSLANIMLLMLTLHEHPQQMDVMAASAA